MASNTEAYRRSAGALGGATTGAQIGAGWGGGWGALIGGVVGAGAGALVAGGLTDAEKEQARRIAELKRMRQLDMLGLAPDERALMEQNLLGSIRASEREQQQAILRATASQDVGAGSFYRQAQAVDDQTIQKMAQQRNAIEAANMRAAAMQRDELQGLIDAQSQAELEERRALFRGLLGIPDASASIGTDIASQKISAQESADVMARASGSPDATPDDYETFSSVTNKYGGYTSSNPY